MHIWLRKPAIVLLKWFDLYSLVPLRDGALKSDGWFRSFREQRAVDAEGRPLPWMNYAVIDFLRRRLRPDMSVFEYGCGSSTLWWAARVARVIAVEHDPAWFRGILAQAPSNVDLLHIPDDGSNLYANSIEKFGPVFDIVLVDGRDRVNCMNSALLGLSPEGVIVLDNSQRVEYESGTAALKAQGFRSIEFSGLVPGLSWKEEATVFYRPGHNCLGI